MFRRTDRRAIAAAAFLTVPSFALAGTAVTFTGPTNGSWSNPANWSGGVVPNNSTYDVTIPSNVYVNYDLTTPTTIEALSNGGNSGTNVIAGSGLLTVTGQVHGTVNATGGSFLTGSTQPGVLDNDFFFVNAGGTLTTSTSTYTVGNGAYGGSITYDMLAASGAGSMLNASSLSTITVNGNSQAYANFQVHATTGGTVNLSGLTSTAYVYGDNRNYLNFVTDYGGTINLSNLASTTQTQFYANYGSQQLPALLSSNIGGFYTGNGATINAPLLNSISNTTVTPSAGGTFNAPSLSTATYSTLNYQPYATLITGTLGVIDYSRLLVNGGTAVNNINASSYTVGNGVFGSNTTVDVLAAGGAGSALNLSSVATITVNGNNQAYAYFQVHAYNGGFINLNGLTTINYTYGDNRDALNIVQETGGSIGLNRLSNVNQVNFTANDGTLSLPSLVTASTTSFSTANGGAISAPNLATVNYVTLNYPLNLTTGTLSNIDYSRFLVAGGVTVGNINASTYTVGNGQFGSNTTVDVLSASGAGSTLNASSISTITVNGNSQAYTYFQVHAVSGGTVNLSGLTSTAYVYGDNRDDLNFIADYGGTINLPRLASTTQTQFYANYGTQQLPALLSANVGGFYTGNGATINAPVLNTVNSITITPGAGGTFNAPSLTTATYSILNYQPYAMLITGTLGVIDYTRLLVTNTAAVNNINASSYTVGNGEFGSNTTIDVLAAGGARSVLNLSSIATISVNGNGQAYTNFQVHAYNGGVVNLSNLTTVNYIYGDNRDALNFTQDTGGSINLNKLSNVNQVNFAANSGTISLPALLSASTTSFSTANGGAISAPNLTTINYVTLNYPINLTTGTLTNLDYSRILVAGGVTVGNFNTSTYAVGNGQYGSNTTVDVLSASGTGSTLNMSSLSTITVNANNQAYTYLQVHASSGGTINLTGLTSTAYIYGDNRDALNFVAETNGVVNLPALRNVTRTQFYAASGGTINLGDIASTSYTLFQTSDANGKLVFNGGLVLDSTSSLNLAPLSTLQVPGRLAFGMTNPSQFQASTAIVKVVGSGVQNVEVGGLDNGPAVYGTAGNFGFGQFQVGSSNQSSVVQLVDVYDNGNRGTTGKEAMYAYGLGGGPAGLVMASGSLMAISGFNVYVNQNGTLVNLQSLIPAGSNIVPYTFGGSNGFILKALTLSPGFYNSSDPGDRDNWTAGSGSWDNAANWSLGITPSGNLEAFITPPGGVTVTGPAAGATVKTLVVDNTGAGSTVLNLSSATGTTTVLGGLELGAAGIINLAAGTLNVGSTLNVGTVQTQPGTVYVSGTILNQGGMTLRGTTTAGAVVNNVSMELAAGSHSFGPVVGPGSFVVDAGAAASLERLRQTSVTINGSVAIRRQPGADLEVSRITTLAMGPAGRLDVADNPLILDSSTLASVATFVASAYAGGAWTGPGIGSSLVGPSTHTGVGYTTAALAGVTTWNGESVTPADVLVKRTLLGDANLDGVVDVKDLGVIAQHYGHAGAGINWTTGDFNYDGVVNVTDLGMLAQNYNTTLSPDGSVFPADSGTAASLMAFAADLAALEAADPTAGLPDPKAVLATVPEPDGVAAVAILAASLLGGHGRRRRNLL